jgi:hypothetical protein
MKYECLGLVKFQNIIVIHVKMKRVFKQEGQKKSKNSRNENNFASKVKKKTHMSILHTL